MVGSPLGILLLIAAVYLIVKSSQKTQTAIRMIIAFVVVVLICVGSNLLLRFGDPGAWGQIGGLVGLLVAVITGWMHVRSARSATT